MIEGSYHSAALGRCCGVADPGPDRLIAAISRIEGGSEIEQRITNYSLKADIDDVGIPRSSRALNRGE